jgi:hypothetical protein
MSRGPRAKLYTRYPLSSILVYNGSTILHFLLGGVGIALGYEHLVGYIMGALYTGLAMGEMYLLMPLKVCPNCAYYRLDNSFCISGMNVVSRKVATEGSARDFPRRAEGLFCPNNLYIAALILPIVAIIPALFLTFSFLNHMAGRSWLACVQVLPNLSPNRMSSLLGKAHVPASCIHGCPE